MKFTQTKDNLLNVSMIKNIFLIFLVLSLIKTFDFHRINGQSYDSSSIFFVCLFKDALTLEHGYLSKENVTDGFSVS